MVQTSTSQKNIWVAASDGDLERVKVGPVHTGRFFAAELIYSNLSTAECRPMSRTPIHTHPCEFLNNLSTSILRPALESAQNVQLRADSRHAAASYAHLELLAYLLSVGGDINLPDDEGETPLFTVETMEAAQFLIANGANVAQENEEGQNVRPVS